MTVDCAGFAAVVRLVGAAVVEYDGWTMPHSTPPQNLPVVADDLTPMERESERLRRLLAHAARCGCVPEIEDAAIEAVALHAAEGIDLTELRPLVEDGLRFLQVLLRLASSHPILESPPTPNHKP